MQSSSPTGLVYPDSLAYLSAFTHAKESVNYFGHKRITEESRKAKCNCWEVIDYISFESIDIIMDLLLDNNNPEYGHRKTLMEPKIKFAGVSIMKHNKVLAAAVIDFSD